MVLSVYFPFLIAQPAIYPKRCSAAESIVAVGSKLTPTGPGGSVGFTACFQIGKCNAFHPADNGVAGVGMPHICVAH